METSLSQACPDCDCDDSPLSIVANILAILTFALGVMAYIAALTAVTRGATKEMEDTRGILEATREQTEQIRQLLNVLHFRADPELGRIEKLVRDSLEGIVAASDDVDGFLRKFNVGGGGLPDGAGMASLPPRLKWWYHEKDKAAEIAKLRESQLHFAAVQLIFLQSKIWRQSDDISDLLHLVDKGDKKF